MVSRQEKAITKTAAILRAARSVVMDGGFAALQMNAVASAADIAVGTIYRYYESRAALCSAIVSVVSQREVDVLSAIGEADGTPSQKMHDAVKTFVARALRGKRLAYGLIFEPIDPEVESTRLRYRRDIAKVFERIIREGITVGEFHDQKAQISATCVVGAFMEGLVGELAPDVTIRTSSAEEIALEIAQLCLAAVSRPRDVAVRKRRRADASNEPIPLRQQPKQNKGVPK